MQSVSRIVAIFKLNNQPNKKKKLHIIIWDEMNGILGKENFN